jgi:hypothetical protein
MITPLAYADSLRIGSVDFVSPDEIKVFLDIEAPSDVALNTGVPRPFPRINNYVLLPCDSGFLVAQIEWITIERSQYPKRKGMQDFGVIDLPFPMRKMSLTPLGVLKEEKDGKESRFTFSRGVEVFPTVGDPVLLPSQTQLKSIVESSEKRFVNIGTSPLASNADVSVDPDRLFGRHLAILGNTGSGKSCSVAGVVRWSIEAAMRSKPCLEDEQIQRVNSRFIILDPNGEYSKAFNDMENVKVNLFGVEANEENGIKQLQVPIWFWNSAEWCAFTKASDKTQRPTLIQALRTVRDGNVEAVAVTPSHDMRRHFRNLVAMLKAEYLNGNPWSPSFPKKKGFYDCLLVWQKDIDDNSLFSDSERTALVTFKEKLDEMVETHTKTTANPYPNFLYEKSTVSELLKLAFVTHSAFGGSDRDILPIDADAPRYFTGESLLQSIEVCAELMKTTDYVETMLMRVRTLLSDSRMKTIITCDEDMTLEKWLNDYICPNAALSHASGAITVIDLSLVPAEVVHIVTAVIARMTLEALQRYRQFNNGETLPSTLIMEEAHTFIRRYKSDTEDNSAHSMCAKVFEKIAREGRKFGLGLVLSSQRPSELSQTVLSQCNTFLLHRISNDKDQELVGKLVPDNLRGLLRELPSLPSQRAILLGWASELPVMVQMKYLRKEHRPQSDDPDYWNIWTDHKPRTVDWGKIAYEWQDTERIVAFVADDVEAEETDSNEVNSEQISYATSVASNSTENADDDDYPF